MKEKKSFKQKVKEFYKKHKTEIIATTLVVIPTGIAAVLGYSYGKESATAKLLLENAEDALQAYNDGKHDGIQSVFNDIFDAGKNGLRATNDNPEIGTYIFKAVKEVVKEEK